MVFRNGSGILSVFRYIYADSDGPDQFALSVCTDSVDIAELSMDIKRPWLGCTDVQDYLIH